jgi:hypothetical protein
VTSQQEIGSLIAAIDDIFRKTSEPLSRFKGRDLLIQQRQVLQQVRSYLVAQQSKVGTAEKSSGGTQIATTQENAAQQIYQVVVKEMESLRADLMQPLQADLEGLRKQRDSLLKEIRQMEGQRQQYHSLAQQQAKQQQIISEFLQGLTGRLQESLTEQVTQAVANIESQLLTDDEARVPERGISPLRSPRRSLHPVQRLEQMRQLQVHSDEMLMSVDATIQVVGEALERNIQAYQASLSQGLERMHGLGQQGEVMFAALVNHLAQQLGREASAISTLLQSQRIQLSESGSMSDFETSQAKPESLLPPTIPPQIPQASVNPPTASEPSVESPLPFPGMELQSQRSNRVNPPVAEPTAPQVPPATQVAENLNPADWEVIELDLNSWDVEPLNESEMETFLQLDIDSMLSSLTLEPTLPDPSESIQEVLPELLTNQPTENLPNPEALQPLDNEATVEDLENLYESLFGTENLTNWADQEEDELANDQWLLEEVPIPSESEELDALEASIFTDLPESLAVHPPTQPETLTESWEDWLFTEAIALIPLNEEPAPIETITALTDLFPEMYTAANLTPDLIDGMLDELNSSEVMLMSAAAEQLSDLRHQEDSYTPASPEEHLLVHEEPEAANIDLWLAQDTIQQLSQDLSRFEGSQKLDVPTKANPPQETTTNFGLMAAEDDFDPSLFPSEVAIASKGEIYTDEVWVIVSDSHVSTPNPPPEQQPLETLNPNSETSTNRRDPDSESNL